MATVIIAESDVKRRMGPTETIFVFNPPRPADPPALLAELVRDAQRSLRGAVEEYGNLEKRLFNLCRYQERLRALWAFSAARTDHFELLLVLLEDVLDFSGPRLKRTQEQLSALAKATDGLSAPEITLEQVSAASRTLRQAGWRTLPEIPDLDQAIETWQTSDRFARR